MERVRTQKSKKKIVRMRISKTSAKKYQEKAHITALISTNRSFAMQRLMRDYNEIKNQTVAVSGVSAHPLDDNFFEWHGNIKAQAQNVYKGAVMHFKFVFPENYPIKGPKIFLLNEGLTHPNVMTGGVICLDMLEEKQELYRGWTSAYSVLSILLQLQNFFFDIDESLYEDKEVKKGIIAAIRQMNEFNCKTCKHKGTTNPWPDFIKGDQDPTLHMMSQMKYKETILKELVCYHRKTTFEETPLGLGINILKIPRTGEFKGLVPCIDFVSLKAYTKEKLRRSMSGDKFTHWFPLYFGSKQDQFLHLCTKALSMICVGNTKQFSPVMVMKIMPKFFTNLVADIVSEKVYTSCRALKIMIYIYRVFLLLINKFPSAKEEVEEQLKKFIKDPSQRHKDFTPSLGDLLTLMTLSSNHKIEEILAGYIDEQMDRQIFWILQALPDFEELINSSSVDDIRAKVCFKAGIVGHQILLFYYYFIKKVIFKDSNSMTKIGEVLDQNHCNLSDEVIDSHQKEIQKILKIDSYRDYYKFLNISPPSDKELNEKLMGAFKNSLQKGYHGKDEVRFVPDEIEQTKLYLSKFPPLEKLITADQNLIPESDPIWKELVLEKFDEVKRMRYKFPGNSPTPFSVAVYLEKIKKDYFISNNISEFPEKGEIRNFFKHYQYGPQREMERYYYLEPITWKQLYLKHYLEIYVKYFKWSADFKYLYKLLDLVQNEIFHFNLYISNAYHLKSDYNYIRVILGKLHRLKHLNIFYTDQVNLKMIKNMIKGINNFSQAGGELFNLQVHVEQSATNYYTKDYNMLSIIDKLPHLKVLDVSNTKLDINTSLRIRNHLYYFKTLEILNLSNCSLNDDMAKEIADGIMKAKCLEKIYLDRNNFSKGLANILYNLAFQPSLKVIDMSNNTPDVSETGIALYKLIKMSQSLEILICRNIPKLIDSLSNEFFYSLGDNSALNYLDLSNSGNILNHCKNLGASIAFNAVKNGALRILLLSNVQLTYKKFVELVDGMHINEEIHFQWYGTALNTNIQKDTKEYYEQKFYCKLSDLDISANNYYCDVNINDLKKKPKNHLGILLENNSNLQSLDLSSSLRINKYFIDMIVHALNNPNGLKYLNLDYAYMTGELVKCFMNAFVKIKEKEPKTNTISITKNEDKKEIKERLINPHIHLEALSLARNKFGYSGIEAISEMLKDNSTLRILNLYSNLFDVNGARRLKDALQVNKTLEYLDIGYNRIKELGFKNIIEGIIANPDNKIRFLASRYNFVKNTLNTSLGIILNNPNSKIEELEISNNGFDDKTIQNVFNNTYCSAERKCKIDIFEILYFLSPERLERTVWISPLNYYETTYNIFNGIKNSEREVIEDEGSHIGIPLFLTIKRGRKVGEKKNVASVDCFIEFIHPNSTNRLLKVAATSGLKISGKKVRVYKAGTKPERLIIKK